MLGCNHTQIIMQIHDFPQKRSSVHIKKKKIVWTAFGFLVPFNFKFLYSFEPKYMSNLLEASRILRSTVISLLRVHKIINQRDEASFSSVLSCGSINLESAQTDSSFNQVLKVRYCSFPTYSEIFFISIFSMYS